MKEGHYTDVHCHGIAGAPGQLSDGTGTYTDSTKTFSCGPFSKDDRPKIGSYYNLNGTHGGNWHEFPRWQCTASDETSDFKDK